MLLVALGALAHPWWVPVLFVVLVGHLTNLCVTLYLHRSVTHGGVVFHPVVAHAMRCWLWLTTGIRTREWVAVHRKHHAFADREGDPHSPALEGLLEVLVGGYFLYRRAASDPELLRKYGHGCPDDAVERRLYSAHPWLGLGLMLAADLALFGVGAGLLVWTAMVLWIPLLAGGIVNGLGHAVGYRNFPTKDRSHNIHPLGMWMLGEELHNNHHADPRSARFRARWWEVDVGWLYIRLLAALRLAQIRYARRGAVDSFRRRYNKPARRTTSPRGAGPGA